MIAAVTQINKDFTFGNVSPRRYGEFEIDNRQVVHCYQEKMHSIKIPINEKLTRPDPG